MFVKEQLDIPEYLLVSKGVITPEEALVLKYIIKRRNTPNSVLVSKTAELIKELDIESIFEVYEHNIVTVQREFLRTALDSDYVLHMIEQDIERRIDENF